MSQTAGHEDWGHCRDNAVAAVGKVLYHQSGLTSGELGASLGKLWVDALPVVHDTTEAGPQHDMLHKLVAKQDERILGPNQANLPHIAEVFVRVIGRGSELLRDEDVAGFQHFFFQQLLPVLRKQGMDLQQAAQRLPPQDQQRFASAAAANGVTL